MLGDDVALASVGREGFDVCELLLFGIEKQFAIHVDVFVSHDHYILASLTSTIIIVDIHFDRKKRAISVKNVFESVFF